MRSSRQRVADLRGRDRKVEVGEPLRMDARRRVVRAARPADDDELYGARYIPPTMPGLDLRERVGSDDEEEFIFRRQLCANLFYSVDGVASFGAFLNARNFNALVP